MSPIQRITAAGSLPARLAGTLAVVASAALIAADGASAAQQLLDFHDRTPGEVVATGPEGLALPGDPVVFNAGANTQSPPNALRMPGDCPDSGGANHLCSTGDHLLEMRFANPARSVALRTGVVVPFDCFELDCPEVKLVGFDAAGDAVAIDVDEVPHEGPITLPLEIDAFDHVISRAVLGIAEDPETGETLLGSQFTAQIDDLTYDVLEPGEPPPPPPPPPAAPSISITSPEGGETFATTDVDVSGLVSAPAGLTGLCAEANGAPSIPPDCRTASVEPDGTFQLRFVRGMRPGPNTIRVWARDGLARTATASVAVNVADGDVDFRAETMEITQVVQTEALPRAVTFTRPDGSSGRLAARYRGVPLSEDKRTIVRLFGAAQGAPSPVRGTTALLHGFRRVEGRPSMRRLGTLRPWNPSPRPLDADPDLAELRADPNGAFNFVLPPEWTQAGGQLFLRGEIAPSTVAASSRDCCAFNNAFEVSQIEFSAARPLLVLAAGLTGRSRVLPPITAPTDDLRSYFEDFRMIWPGRTVIADTGRTFDLGARIDRASQCVSIPGGGEVHAPGPVGRGQRRAL